MERYIAPDALADDQLSLAISHGPANQRTEGQHFKGTEDLLNPITHVLHIKLLHVIQEAIQVVKYLGSKLDACHAGA